MGRQKKRRLNFGLLLDWVSGWEEAIYYQSSILSGVNDFAKENDINLFSFITGRITATQEYEKMRNILFDMTSSKNLDGIIILAASIGLKMELQSTVDFLKKFEGIPIVTINNGLGNFPDVSINNHMGMKKVIDHLIEVHNCNKIAFIKGPEDNAEAQERYKAYTESLSDHSIPYNPDLIYQDTLDFNYFSGTLAIRDFLDKKVKFDAIAASNDNMAIGALLELNSRTDEIQTHIPVTGFDDTLYGKNFSLTTVRQSFYDQAKESARILYNIITENKEQKNVELPAEIVIRSSCGCVSDNIIEAGNVYYNTNKEQKLPPFNDIKDIILNDLSTLNATLSDKNCASLMDLEHNSIHSLYDEINPNKRGNFLNSWSSIIFWATANNINLFLLEEIITVLRKKFLPLLSEISDIEKIEGLLHSARIQVVEAIQRSEASRSVFSYIYSQGLGMLGENLISSFDFNQQLDVISRELPKCGINHGFISLFEDPENPLKSSRLVIAFNKDGMINLDEKNTVFPTNELLPESVRSIFNMSRSSFIVQALYHGDTYIGFSMLDLNRDSVKSIESIRYRLSFAFKGAMLVDKIEKQAQNLENQVKLRTNELTQANKQLENEIAMRKDAEEQLKGALYNLKVYNKKLSYQSLRDELTGLYNRRGFMSLGLQYYQYAKKTKKSFMVIYADMDGLKHVNDTYGHKEGDFALIRISKILSRSFRNMDIVARLSGDEFTVLMIDSTPRDFVELTRRLRTSFDNFNKTSGKPYTISISIGSSYFDPSSPMRFDELMAQADQALYDQKQSRTFRMF